MIIEEAIRCSPKTDKHAAEVKRLNLDPQAATSVLYCTCTSFAAGFRGRFAAGIKGTGEKKNEKGR